MNYYCLLVTFESAVMRVLIVNLGLFASIDVAESGSIPIALAESACVCFLRCYELLLLPPDNLCIYIWAELCFFVRVLIEKIEIFYVIFVFLLFRFLLLQQNALLIRIWIRTTRVIVGHEYV
jgi:hypothetical protein